jgi:hypothetical protein
VLLKKPDVCIAGQEPQVFDDDVLPRNLFGGEERKAVPEIDLVVDVERGDGIDTRAILFAGAFLEDFPHSLEINFHSEPPEPKIGDARTSKQ